jgi:hypothetical protein
MTSAALDSRYMCCCIHFGIATPQPRRSFLLQEYATDRVIVSFKPDVVVAMAAEEEGLKFMKPAGLQVCLCCACLAFGTPPQACARAWAADT